MSVTNCPQGHPRLLQNLQSAGGAQISTLVAVDTVSDLSGIHELGLDHSGEATANQTQQTLANFLAAGTDTEVTQNTLALVALDGDQAI